MEELAIDGVHVLLEKVRASRIRRRPEFRPAVVDHPDRERRLSLRGGAGCEKDGPDRGDEREKPASDAFGHNFLP